MIRDKLINNQPSNSPQFNSIALLTSVSKVLAFLRTHLPDFQKEYQIKITQKKRENDISEQINFFLQGRANYFLFSVNFEKGADFSIMARPYALDAKPILLIEAKRLPPTNHKDYVYRKNLEGGIERFKREQAGFGQDLEICVMLGYVQEHDFAYWEQKVNLWIEECIKNSSSNDEIRWGSNELLAQSPHFPPSTQVAEYISHHSRKTQNDIQLYHFWLNLCLPKSSFNL